MEDEQSEKTIEEQEEMLRGGRGGGGTSFAHINEDLLHNILSRLPALSFASAACVSRAWNRVSNRILSRPKLASALSLNSTLQDAVKEVLDKVLSVPIRPHFAVACIGLKFSLKTAHKLIAKRLGSTTPIITSVACGIIGSDARTNNFREVKWGDFDGGLNAEAHNLPENVNRGIVLIVGFVPGLKVDAIPLLQSMEEPHASMVDKFVMDIRHYTASVSGSTSPSAILMIGNQHADMKPVLDKLDYAMSTETVIAGDESGCFLFGSEDNSRYLSGISEDLCDAVALVFARDRDKSEGIGETQFHVTLSTGVSPVGPTHKAVSVRVKGIKSDCSTWLTARREGLKGTLDGQRMLNDINDEMENSIACHDLYIGVTKRRKCSIGLEKAKLVTSFAFHEVLGGDEEYLFVDGAGIKTGDSFRFYHSDSDTASSSCAIVSENLRNLKQDWNCENCRRVSGVAHNGDKNEVWGGIIFSCYGRGESFFGHPNVDSSPFLENFPGISLAGIFCAGEIGRGCSNSIRQEGQDGSSVRCCLCFYSTVYLVMSYTPALPEQEAN